MIFKEIAFDLPYIANEDEINRIMNENNCTRNDAVKVDYEQNWKSKRRDFSLRTRCISSMFERLMGKISTHSCSKLLIECVPFQSESLLLDFSEINTFKIQFDYDSFKLLDNNEKKKLTLEMLMKGVQALSEKEKLDFQKFIVVYNQIVESNYRNEWVWQKSIKSPNKKLSAELIINHEVELVYISILIRNINGNIMKVEEILTDLPDEYAYSKHLGRLSWQNDKTISLINKKGDKNWVVSI